MNDDEFDLLDGFEDDDEVINNNSDPEPEPEPQYEEQKDESDNLLLDLLKERGISNPEEINFEGDDGIIRKRSWDNLTYEELKNILNQAVDADPDTDLNDDEIDLINEIRKQGMTPQEYKESLKVTEQTPIQEQSENPTYAVDDLTDEELFVLDLQSNSEDITDEEAVAALLAAKENEILFNKQITGLRNKYKNLEDARNQEIEAQRQAEQEEQMKEFSNSISSSIDKLNSIGTLDIDLDQDDKEELADFILGQDDAGVSYFGKALNDPETLVQMAWFALHGEDTFNEINSYMSDQLKRVAQQYYNKGLAEGKKGTRLVINKLQPRNNNRNNESFDSLEDLDFN